MFEFRLDSGGLIDIEHAQRAQSAGLCRLGYPDFRLKLDEGNMTFTEDSSVPLARDLNFVLEHVRDNYRPLKWAQILRTVAVPDWAENWEVSRIVGTGGIKLASQHGPHDIIRGDFSRTSTTGKMIELVNGYYYSTRELVRYAKLGINAETERAMAQAQAADEFMDMLCATGSSGTDNPIAGLGFTGLLNNASVDDALVVGTTKASTTTSWTTAVAADFPLVIKDLHALTDAVYTASKERRNADTILMPLDEFQAINSLRPSNYADNVLTRFQAEWNAKIGRQGRIMVWDRAAALGSISSGPRITAFDSSDTNVACVMVGKPYGVDQVLEITRGYEANASLVTGGVRILDESGIKYLDIAA
jgi:hypothetical protein